MASKAPPPELPKKQVLSKKMDFALMEVEHLTEVITNVNKICYEKCVDKKYREPDLFIGEICCLNRCVSKYLQVKNLVGNILAYGQSKT